MGTLQFLYFKIFRVRIQAFFIKESNKKPLKILIFKERNTILNPRAI